MKNKVFNMDCLEGMQMIPDKSIDMILCDLPYGTTACKWDVIIPFAALWKHYERIIKDNGAIVLTASQPFTSMLVMSNPKLFKYEWIWDKKQGTGHLNAKKKPLLKHETILVFSKTTLGNFTYNPQMSAGNYRNKSPKHSTDLIEGRVYGIVRNQTDNFNDVYYPKSIYELSNADQKNSLHPTQKPIALFEYLIKTYTNEGETVLDNCMGSGTTAIACINTGRNYIGFEKEEKYYNIIHERIKNTLSSVNYLLHKNEKRSDDNIRNCCSLNPCGGDRKLLLKMKMIAKILWFFFFSVPFCFVLCCIIEVKYFFKT